MWLDRSGSNEVKMKKQRETKINTPERKNVLTGRNVNPKDRNFAIVGIGASAGGLEALEQFFSNMDPISGLSFIVIQHLDPTHKGLLGELIQRITEMKVITVTDRLTIQQNCVYVIPPNKSMSILHGTLYLFDPFEQRGLRLPIDFFFRALAEDCGELSVGIVLSGMGSDGSAGLRAIKEKGGLALVQDPLSAKFDSMPNSAIDAVQPDIVASAAELPEKLLMITRHPRYLEPAIVPVRDTSALEKIILLLRSQTGHDFSLYKKNTMYRRIERRINIHHIDKIATYVRFLQENAAEVNILFNELLIGVTSFFRDPDVWQKLSENAFPKLCENLPYGYILRAWIPGCSTGEEAYSLAIIFREFIERTKSNMNLSLQIFATDIDISAIEKARKGIYPLNISPDVSPTRLKQFFTRSDDKFRINPSIREMIVFAPHNVIRDPPFTKLDLLSCRNVLIYMEPELQKKLLSLFHKCLNINGFLLLGNSENNGANKDLLITFDSKQRIYRRSESTSKGDQVDFPSSFSVNRQKIIDTPPSVSLSVSDNLQVLVEGLLLQQFSPASVLVTNNGDILYITGNVGKYLSPVAGKANMNLFAMACEGLRNELPIAIRKATRSYEKIILRNIKVGTGEEPLQHADITIQQIEKPAALKGRIIFLFNDVPELEVKSSKSGKGRARNNPDFDILETEFQRIKEELQNTREEMQTTQEEQKSTNEELQSTNEELQSSNEELTSSKEEMQSMNEELHSLNVELQSKIDYSLRLNNDMNNLLNSIEIAILFLDRELNIRQYSNQSTKIFKLKNSDLGRLFTDQVSILKYSDLYDDAVSVLQTLAIVEKEIATTDNRWFKTRIMPYRTSEDKIDGLVITFIDITKQKYLELSLKRSQITLRSLIMEVPGIIIGLSPDGVILEFNREAEKLFERKQEDVIGKNYFDLFVPESSRKKINADIKKLQNGSLPDKYVNTMKTGNGNKILMEWSAHTLFDDDGKNWGAITIGVNKTKA